jgi:hypothetical protein
MPGNGKRGAGGAGGHPAHRRTPGTLGSLRERRIHAAGMFEQGVRQVDVMVALGVSAQTASRWHHQPQRRSLGQPQGQRTGQPVHRHRPAPHRIATSYDLCFAFLDHTGLPLRPTLTQLPKDL